MRRLANAIYIPFMYTLERLKLFFRTIKTPQVRALGLYQVVHVCVDDPCSAH